MASVLPSDANTFRIVSSWGLASPRSILAIWGCLTPLRASSWRWLMPCSCLALISSVMSATRILLSAISSGVKCSLSNSSSHYRETALRIIHAFPSLSLKSANSRLACSISRFGVFWDFFTKLCRRTKAPSTHPANRIRSSIGRSSQISPSRCLAYFSGR